MFETILLISRVVFAPLHIREMVLFAFTTVQHTEHRECISDAFRSFMN